MKSTLLLLPAVAILCAAASTKELSSLRDEAPPRWLPVPVAGVRSSQLRDTWGAARSGGRSHEGIDILAKRGTPVLSTTHGIVTAVQVRDLGGNTVSVLGPGGQSHYYAHLDSYGRYVPGDRVDVGDTLGYVGNTGNAQGGATHLHYGIYTDTGAINPYPLLVAKKSGSGAVTVPTTSPKADPGKPTQQASAVRKGTKKGAANATTIPPAPAPNGGYTSRARR